MTNVLTIERTTKKLSRKAQEIVAKRYSLKDEAGNPIEDWEAVCRRVSNAVMGESENREALFQMMLSTVFIPNTPCLVNAGKPDGQLAACFVLHVPDSIDGIMEHAQVVANIHKSGGGTGMSYEFLRPHGMQVSTSGGSASGPVSFMEIVNKVTEVVKQGGVRRGANMGIMSIKHPDVLRFIHAKNDQTTLTNFNISVTVTDDFMAAVKEKLWFQLEFDGKPWDRPIYDPVTETDYSIYYSPELESACNYQTKELLQYDPECFADRKSFVEEENYWKTVSAKMVKFDPPRPGMVYAPDIWNRIIASAHKYAEPGVIFIDQVNRSNYLKNTRGLIYSCNPCVTGDTLISTADGLLSAKELAEAGSPVTVLIDSRFGNNFEFSEASKVFPTGVKEVFLVTTKEGYRIRATADHRIMTTNGWKEVSNLKANDRIHIADREGGFGNFGTLEEGRVWGWIVGDGSISKEGFRAGLNFYDKDMGLAREFAGYVNNMVTAEGFPTREYSISPVRFNERRLGIHSERLYRIGERLGFAEDKYQIPAVIFRSSENMQRGFLQALFSADGTVAVNHQKGSSVRLASVSEKLLVDVQRLLLNFGIASKIYWDRKKNQKEALLPDGKGGSKFYPTKPFGELCIANSNLLTFSRKIGFLQKEKQSKLENCLKGYQRNLNKETFTARIAEIMPDGVEQVYDLTEPFTHSFIANGIVVHNCGEEFLHANNSCNLGSIDVSKFISEDKVFDKEGFKRAIHLAVEFLDNVVDASVWTTPEIDATVKATRPVGLGLMGIGDALIKLQIPYGSDEAVRWLEELTMIFQRNSWRASFKLGREKGVFPEFEDNREHYEKFFNKIFGLCNCWLTNDGHLDGSDDCRLLEFTPRNYEVTTIAPTGTISLIAGCSSGVEPNFDFSFVREDTISKSGMVHPLAAKYLGIEYDENDQESIFNAAKEVSARRGELPDYFVGAMDITALQHVKMLAAAQKYIDNSISKTCNGAKSDTVESVADLYIQAYQLGCKAVSYYRDGSRDGQVLSVVKTEEKKAEEVQPETVQQETVVKPAVKGEFKRPAALAGKTYRFQVGGSYEYFTINKDENGNVVEVFNSGGNVSASVGLLMSKMIQSGCFDTEELARTLDKSKGEFSIVIEGRIVTSPEQAFAHLLRVESGAAMSAKDKINKIEIQSVGNGNGLNGHDSRNTVPMYECPECHVHALVKESGCESCKNCLYSKC